MAESVLITGASRGIGRALARAFAGPDRALFLTARSADLLASLARDLASHGTSVHWLAGDLRDPAFVAQLARQVLDTVGPPQIAVLNAGIARVGPLERLSLEDFNDLVAVNLRAPFLLTRELLPHLRAGATLVYIGSIAAKEAFSHWSLYCATKFGLRGMVTALREEVRGRGIRVILVNPGPVATPLWETIGMQADPRRMLTPEDVARVVVKVATEPAHVSVDEIDLLPQQGLV